MSDSPNITSRRLDYFNDGGYRDGGLTVGEAVAAYREEDITVSRAAEACGLSWQEMADALRDHGVDPRMGPTDTEELR